MSSDDIAISVRNLTKTYRLFSHPGDRVKQFFSFGLWQYHREFTALKDVSFDIRKGETVGIVGRNGSGKSTLLQLICGILKPTAGSVQVNGRVSALLELGAGFNPEFTGRENVYFQGALMGFTETQMDERFDDIAAFADIGEFIDQPVRTYSSGMYVRLAFATMIHLDADILVIDEAIAVGDAGFRARCFRRLGELGAAGGTILFVTHAMEQVTRFCGHAILLDQGSLRVQGQPADVVAEYLRLQAVMPGDLSAASYSLNGAEIEVLSLLDAGDAETRLLRPGRHYRCQFNARLDRPASGLCGAFLIRSPGGAELAGARTLPIDFADAAMGVTVDLRFCCRLNPGVYQLDVALFAREGEMEFALHGIRNAIAFEVDGVADRQSLGAFDMDCQAAIVLADAGATK